MAGGKNKEAREALSKGEFGPNGKLSPRGRNAHAAAALGEKTHSHTQLQLWGKGSSAPGRWRQAAPAAVPAPRALCGRPPRDCSTAAPRYRASLAPQLAHNLHPVLPPAAAPGATTKAGTWAPTEDDAKFIELMVDMEEKWQQVRHGFGGSFRRFFFFFSGFCVLGLCWKRVPKRHRGEWQQARLGCNGAIC